MTPGSPLLEAGLQVGAVVVDVAGTPLMGLSLGEAATILRKAAQTRPVKIKFLSKASDR